MPTLTRLFLSVLVACAIAAIMLATTRFHVFFFPFVFVVGAPLWWWIWKPNSNQATNR